MDLKDKVDILGKKADILYKKVVILLASAGGSGAYAVKFAQDGSFILSIVLGIFFIFSATGIGILYMKLDSLEKEISYE